MNARDVAQLSPLGTGHVWLDRRGAEITRDALTVALALARRDAARRGALAAVPDDVKRVLDVCALAVEHADAATAPVVASSRARGGVAAPGGASAPSVPDVQAIPQEPGSTAGAGLLTARQVADQVGLSSSQVRRLARQGRIAAIKIGPVWAINGPDAASFAARREAEHDPGQGRDQDLQPV